jgi:hypothetical protein
VGIEQARQNKSINGLSLRIEVRDLLFKKRNVIANNIVSDKHVSFLKLLYSLQESTFREMVKDRSAAIESITHNNAVNAGATS